MCCEPSGYEEKEINGVCSECGNPTVNGEAFEHCSYSPCLCHHCNWKPCDGSC